MSMNTQNTKNAKPMISNGMKIRATIQAAVPATDVQASVLDWTTPSMVHTPSDKLYDVAKVFSMKTPWLIALIMLLNYITNQWDIYVLGVD